MSDFQKSKGQAIKPPKRNFSAGFSLVELMVAMVIGLLAIIVMMQMFSVFEEQKRTTTGGDDALSSGAIALNTMQQDIGQAGWGLNSVRVLGCNITGLATATIPLVPVTINPAGITAGVGGVDVNTDTVMIVSGNTNGSVEGVLISSQPVLGDPVLSKSFPDVYGLESVQSFTVADRVFAMPEISAASPRAVPCNLTRTTITGVNRPNVGVAAGVAGMVKGRLFNLGATPVVRVYAIRSGTLSVCDYIANDCTGATGWVGIADNIVSMRVQYGRDTNDAAPLPNTTNRMDGIVDVWDQAVATTATPISVAGAYNVQECGYVRTPAIRLALVARSSQPEKPGTNVTPAAPTWAGGDSVAAAVSATNAAAVEFVLPSPNATWPTWHDFRYKVLQTTVPLRNIAVMGAAAEC